MDLYFNKNGLLSSRERAEYSHSEELSQYCYLDDKDYKTIYVLFSTNNYNFVVRTPSKNMIKRRIFCGGFKYRLGSGAFINNLKDLPAEEMKKKNTRITTLNSEDFGGQRNFESIIKRTSGGIGNLDNTYDGALIEVFESKLKIDGINLREIDSVIESTDTKDPLYKDLLKKREEKLELYKLYKKEHYDAIKDLHKFINGTSKSVLEQRQLNILAS